MATESSFKAGDIVRTKSGGPKMTVEVIGDFLGSARVQCVWFVGTKLFRDTFAPEALEPASGQ